MLELKHITKDYKTGDETVHALRGVSIAFRESEFVSILGQSGCGKTTLLNIIGGLDRYSDGDLYIGGRSTREFSQRDWDTYRNHAIGFVFQSYNLIPHQTVLSNVELALTLSGVSKAERRRRALDALARVGLADQIKKKPAEMSGGQMQRVAIARALVNDPDIILADEPTGALDSETSIQIMDLLREIAETKLVIMVTHNAELAEQYSTRTIRLLDGKIIGDSDPYDTASEGKKEKDIIGKRKSGMSFFTALNLSLNNLMTKKARTFLTSFAGSIGIIGIALILSLSSGVRAYISRVEEDTLSSYPMQIEAASVDMTTLMSSLVGIGAGDIAHELDKVYSNDMMREMIDAMLAEIKVNNLTDFRDFIENGDSNIKELVSDIKYIYSTPLNIYSSDTSNGVYKVNPSAVMSEIGMMPSGDSSSGMMSSLGGMSTLDVWAELMDNEKLLKEQYDVVAGKLPSSYNEVVLILDENNEITDYALYALGLKDINELKQVFEAIMRGENPEKGEATSYSYDDILSLTFKLLPQSDYFEYKDGVYTDRSGDEVYLINKLASALEIKVVGILRPSENATATMVSGGVGYLSSLTEYLVNYVANSDVVKAQKAAPELDVTTGKPFKSESVSMTYDQLVAYIATLDEAAQLEYAAAIEQLRGYGMDDETIAATISESMSSSSGDNTYDANLTRFGAASIDEPSAIYIYPADFEAKEAIEDIINEYNSGVGEADQIRYTDYIGLILSSVTTIINAISYILIAFVAISLVVSSIMIGIITYISVLERTKEIGILRAMGASRRDVSRVFNAETLIVGFSAGIIGIGVTLLLLIPINAIILALTDIAGMAVLPWAGAIILIVISMALTFIAGMFPAKLASRRDPVIALRSE